MCKENEDNRLRTIYVGDLAWKTTSDDLRRYFQRFGEVVHAYIIFESSTGRSKGFGFVRFKDDESAAKALENRNPIIDGRTTNCNLAHNKNQHKQKDSSNHAEPSHRYQPSSQQTSTSQQYQPNSQYCPSIVWDPISRQYYYIYNNKFDSYTNSMILYQDWINMTSQQNHVNTNTDQENIVVVDNDQDVITIVDGDVDDQEKIELSDTDEEEEEDTTKKLDEEAVEEEIEDFQNLSFSDLDN